MKKFFTLVLAVAVGSLSIIHSLKAQIYDWRQMNSNFSIFASYPGNPNVVFAGDQAGMIKKSMNQGQTWKLISMEAETAINDIVFLDNNIGYAAVNESGLILITNDGGATWKRHQFADTLDPSQPLSSVVKRIVRVDAQTAFFDVFSHPISTVSTPKTIATRDAGATYSVVFAPGHIYYVAGDTMVALGRQPDNFGIAKFTVFRSFDKGATWSVFKFNPTGFPNGDFGNHGINPYTAQFINANIFYITANKSLSSVRNIYKTTDGGLTFTALPLPTTGTKFDWFYFKNQQEAVALMQNGQTYFTTNGGTNWTLAAKNVAFPGLYLGGQKFLAQVKGVSYESNDFGNNWTAHSDNLLPSLINASPNLFVLKLVNDSVAFASLGVNVNVYQGFNLIKTSNKGVTWRYVKDATDGYITGEAFHFVSADTFFYTGTGYNQTGTQGGYLKIKYTTNGGLTASEVFTGNYQEKIKDFIFIDKKHAVAYGPNPWVNFSSDSGKTWTMKFPSPSLPIQVQMMACPSVNSWYLLSTSSTVYKSTDQGASWTNITGTMVLSTGGTNCNSGIYFLNENLGYVYGCEGKLYKTTDGGQNWTDIRNNLSSSIINNDLLSFGFQNSNTGYAGDYLANGGRYIMKTADGGASWNYYPGVQSAQGVMNMNFRDENTAAMITNTGAFIKYIGVKVFTTQSIQFTNVTTALFNKSTQRNIEIYPNPTKGMVNIRMIENQKVNVIQLSDLAGKKIRTFEDHSVNGVAQISTAGIEPGIYLLEVHSDTGIISGKIVVE